MVAKVNKRYRYNSGVVTLVFYSTEKKLLGIELNNSDHLKLKGVFLTKSNKFLEETISKFKAYFEGETKELDIVVDEYVTEFENKVYEEVKKVKFGETIKLAELAKKVGATKKETAEALRNNRYPIIVPTHRVLSEKGLEVFVAPESAKKALKEFEAVK